MTELSPGDRRYDNIGYFSWAAAQDRPDALAIIDLSRDPPVEITYRRLEERLDRLAALTRRLGLVPGDRLAMAVGNRFEFIEAMYGAMRAGIVPVPLNTRQAADGLDYIVKDAACVAALVEPAGLPGGGRGDGPRRLARPARPRQRAARLARLRAGADGDARPPSTRRRCPATTPRSSPTPRARPAGPRG